MAGAAVAKITHPVRALPVCSVGRLPGTLRKSLCLRASTVTRVAFTCCVLLEVAVDAFFHDGPARPADGRTVRRGAVAAVTTVNRCARVVLDPDAAAHDGARKHVLVTLEARCRCDT